MHAALLHTIGTLFNIISGDLLYKVKTKLRPDKILCYSTYHIKNVSKRLQFLIYDVLSIFLLSMVFFEFFKRTNTQPFLVRPVPRKIHFDTPLVVVVVRCVTTDRPATVTYISDDRRVVTGCRRRSPRWRCKIVASALLGVRFQRAGREQHRQTAAVVVSRRRLYNTPRLGR